MNEITTHHTNPSNKCILLSADDPDPKYGNASHVYKLTLLSAPLWDGKGEEYKPQEIAHLRIDFQHGPIKEVGVNGLTNEVLLAIVKHRLEGFQSGPFACSENQGALESVNNALTILESRTKAREARGVEGTNQV